MARAGEEARLTSGALRIAPHGGEAHRGPKRYVTAEASQAIEASPARCI